MKILFLESASLEISREVIHAIKPFLTESSTFYLTGSQGPVPTYVFTCIPHYHRSVYLAPHGSSVPGLGCRSTADITDVDHLEASPKNVREVEEDVGDRKLMGQQGGPSTHHRILNATAD